MRIKSDGDGFRSEFSATANNLAQHRSVRTVHAIEVADAGHGRPEARDFVEIAKYAHGSDLELQLQSVMREAHMIGQRPIGLLMRQVVRHVCKKGACWFEPLDELERIFEAGVGWVRAAAQRVEKQNVEPGEIGDGLFGNGVEVRYIGGVAEAICSDGVLAVQHLQRLKDSAEQLQGTVEAVHLHAGQAAIFVSGIEDIVEHLIYKLCCFRVGVKQHPA